MDGILASMKKMLNIDDADKGFDVDIIIHINSTISKLFLLGVTPPHGFKVTAEGGETWTTYLGNTDDNMLDDVKSYMYLKLRLIFDPPGNSFLVSAIEKQINEYGWDISILAEVT